MKLILTLFIIFFYSNYNIYSQNNYELDFEKMTDNEKSIVISAYKLKSVKNSNLFHKSMDSIRKTLGKSHKLYPFIITISATENHQRGEYDNAIIDYNELINLYPENKIDILHKLSVLYTYISDFDKSTEVLKQIIKLKPDESLAYSNLANKQIILGKYSKALKTLNSNKSDDRIPNDDKHYAIIYFNKNKIDKAKNHIDNYIKNEFGSEDYSGYLIAAKIYDKLNLTEKACNYINKANKLSSTMNLEESNLKEGTILYKKIKTEINEINTLMKAFCK